MRVFESFLLQKEDPKCRLNVDKPSLFFKPYTSFLDGFLTHTAPIYAPFLLGIAFTLTTTIIMLVLPIFVGVVSLGFISAGVGQLSHRHNVVNGALSLARDGMKTTILSLLACLALNLAIFLSIPFFGAMSLTRFAATVKQLLAPTSNLKNLSQEKTSIIIKDIIRTYDEQQEDEFLSGWSLK